MKKTNLERIRASLGCWLSLLLFVFLALGNGQQAFGQTIGTTTAQLQFYEYYNHVSEREWSKLFTIKNYDPAMGHWGKGGVSGRVYFVDYQGYIGLLASAFH